MNPITRKAAELAEQAKEGVTDAAEALAAEARRQAGALADAAGEKAEEVRTSLGHTLRRVQDNAAEAKDSIVAGAGPALSALRDGAIEKADEARETLSDVGDRLAATLARASENEAADALKARALSSVASGLSSASAALRQRSVADLTGDLRALARQHPGAFMAAAAVAGFAVARFLRSSAQRAEARHTDSGGRRA